MQYHGSETFTVKSPILPFLDHATLQESTGRIFWNTITLHRLLVEDGMYSHKEGRWFQRVQKIAADHCIAPDDCIPRPTAAQRSGCVDCYLIGTASLIAWMTTQCTANQAKPAIKDMCSKWLAAITEKALLSHSRLAVTAAAIIVGPSQCHYYTWWRHTRLGRCYCSLLWSGADELGRCCGPTNIYICPIVHYVAICN